jgi:hypothetical protein
MSFEIPSKVAFFNAEGKSRVTDPKKDKTRGNFFGFSRTAYGIVKSRTDGNRMITIPTAERPT